MRRCWSHQIDDEFDDYNVRASRNNAHAIDVLLIIPRVQKYIQQAPHE